MSDINLTADFSEAIDEIIKVQNLSKSAADALKQWTQATVAFNNVSIMGVETLKKTDLVIKSLISDTQELTAKLHDEGAGWELVSSSVKEVNSAKAKLAQVSRELAQVNREASQAAKQFAAEDNIRSQQRLRQAQAESQANRRDFQKQVASQSYTAIKQQASGLNLSSEAQSQVVVLSQKIAQLGTQAGLSTAELLKMFNTVKSGDFSSIEGKYSKVVAALQQYNKAIEPKQVKQEPFPTPNLDKISSYANILTRIQSTLTNLALYRGFNILTNSLSDSVGASRELQVEISLIRTLTQDSQQSAQQYGDAIKRVSNESGFAAKEIAELFYDIASNQVAAGSAIEDVARKAAELARVVKSTPKEAGNLLASVVNTYGAEAGSLDEVSAKLFKTIDLGRVTAGELQNSFGRVENTGKELGVTFNELLASMSSLTITGLKTDESMTLLFNVMKALRNPTKEMSNALLDIGYASGPTAVKTEGLLNILKKLTDAGKQGKLDLANLFPDAREQRFIAAFTNDTKVFEENLKKIKSSSGTTFANAKDIRSESDADKLNRGLQVFKNAAIGTFGNQITSLISSFVDLTSKSEDLEKRATKLFQQVGVGVVTFGAFKAIMTALGALSELQAARALRLAAATDVATTAQLRNNAASRGGFGGLVGSSPVLAGVGLFATLATGYLAYKATVTDGNEELGRSFHDLYERVRQESLSKDIEKSTTEATKLKETLKEASQSLASTLGKGITQNQKSIDEIQGRLKEGADALKSSFAGVASITSDSLRDTEGALNRIRSEKERIIKQQGTHQDAASNAVFGTLGKFANPYQQLELISSQYNQVENKIQSLIKKGTVEDIQEAEKLQDQKLKLVTEFYEKSADLDHQNFQKELQYKAQTGQLSGAPGEQTFTYNPTKQIEATNRVLADREALETRVLVLLEKQRVLEETKLAKQKELQKAQQLAITEYEKFNVLDDKGEVKGQYKDKFGKFDSNKAKADFDKVSKDLVQTITPLGVGPQDVFTRLGIGKQIAEDRNNRTQLLERVKVQKDLEKTQNDVYENEKKGAVLIDKSSASLKNYNAEALKELDNLKAIAEGLKKIAASAPDAIHDQSLIGGLTGTDKGSDARRFGIRKNDELDQAIGGNYTAKGLREIKPVYKQIEILVDETLKEIADAKANLKEVKNGKVVDPEAVRNAEGRLNDLFEKLGATIRQQLRTETGVRPPEGFRDQDPNRLRIPGFPETLGNLKDTFNSSSKGFSEKGGPLYTSGLELSRQAEAVQQVQRAADDAARSMNSLSNSVVALRVLIDKVASASVVPTTRTPQDIFVPPPSFTPQDQGDKGIQRFYGGLIDYKAYGGPVGQDRNMAWLADGESVLNQRATQRFYSRIMQMNNMSRIPQYFNGGGVVTNMGGVKFHIDGAQNPKATAREVHNMLKRAKRAGTI